MRLVRDTSIGHRQPTWIYDGCNYLFPQSLRGSCQMLYSKVIKSVGFNLEKHIFYIWTLDLLYHTLQKAKAMKSDELTNALSKSFIPLAAHILFPRRIKRVRKAVNAYLEKFGPLSFNVSSTERVVHHSTRLQPQQTVNYGPGSSKRVLSNRDMVEGHLKPCGPIQTVVGHGVRLSQFAYQPPPMGSLAVQNTESLGQDLIDQLEMVIRRSRG